MTSYGGADLFEYMKHMTIKEALNLGLINKEAYSIVRSEKFWRFFLGRDYPYFVLDKDENPESAYRKIYDNRDVEEVINDIPDYFVKYKYHQNIHTLHCYGSQLTSLKGCPPCEDLYCYENELTSLDGCPEGVKKLDCSDNRLTSLVGCPSSVIELNCSDNQLTSLDGCPLNIEELNCDHNQLRTLDIYLPRLDVIGYDNNPLIPPWNTYEEEIIDIMNNPR